MNETKKKMNPLGWLIMIIGLLGMIAFILIYWGKVNISFLTFLFKESGETIVPNTMITFIFGAASIVVFLLGLMSKSKKVKK